MEGIILIALIVILLLLLYLYIALDPEFDTIVINGKKRRIIWYNGRDGRDWTFLW